MKIKAFLVTALMTSIASGVVAQSFPLSENNWNNPEFVERFLGSYGFLTGKEPQITSDESEVFKELGDIISTGDTASAIRFVEGKVTPEASAALDYTLGNLQLQRGDYNLAIRAYEKAIRKFPNFLRAYKNVGLAYVQTQNFEKAREYLAKSIELGNQEGDSFGLLGYCYLNLGKSGEALDAYRMAGVLSPNNKDWQVGKATALQRVGLYKESLAKFNELLEKYPNTKTYYTAAANSCLALQDELGAAKYLDLAVRKGIADKPAKMLLGDIYLNQGLYALSVGVYENIVKDARTIDLKRMLRYAKGLVYMGAVDEADRFMEKIEARSSSMTDAEKRSVLNLRAKIYFEKGDSETAVASLEKVISIDPTNGEALLLLGEHFFGADDFETSLFYYERAQNLESSKLDAFVQAARVKVAQRKFAEAADLLQRAQSIKFQDHVEDYLKAVKGALKSTF